MTRRSRYAVRHGPVPAAYWALSTGSTMSWLAACVNGPVSDTSVTPHPSQPGTVSHASVATRFNVVSRPSSLSSMLDKVVRLSIRRSGYSATASPPKPGAGAVRSPRPGTCDPTDAKSTIAVPDDRRSTDPLGVHQRRRHREVEERDVRAVG